MTKIDCQSCVGETDGLNRIAVIRKEILALGHEVKLIPAQFVKPFCKSHKNDFQDAEAVVRLLILLPWVAPISLGSIGWLWICLAIASPRRTDPSLVIAGVWRKRALLERERQLAIEGEQSPI
jgi:hypothetical protein